jgi:hypothetical protein
MHGDHINRRRQMSWPQAICGRASSGEWKADKSQCRIEPWNGAIKASIAHGWSPAAHLPKQRSGLNDIWDSKTKSFKLAQSTFNACKGWARLTISAGSSCIVANAALRGGDKAGS